MFVKKEITQWTKDIHKYDKAAYKTYKKIKTSLDPKTMSQSEIREVMTTIG